MTERRSPSDHAPTDRTATNPLKRRAFLGAGSGIGVALLAGCASENGTNDASESDADDSSDGSAEGDGSSGTFRLLISDLPADIGDFDSLEVTLDRARIHRAKDEETDDEGDETEGDGGDDEAEDEETDAASEDGDEEPKDDEESDGEDDSDGDEESDDEGDDGERGFYEIDLEDATVDLTQVVGDRAKPVFEGELSEGSYSKIELYVAEVDGLVDGGEVPVKVPSEKLQITKSFEVGGGAPVSFVFDINVVEKGNGGYNLLPVISKSGVAGKDVDVEELDDEDDTESDDEDETDGDDEPGGADESGENGGP